ncbi:MAG: amidohydrolase [Clostridium sp.]|nr:amidohydrolase [Clostridium sp.]
MDVKASVSAHKAHMVELRRQIHQNPELGWHEFETQALIIKELERLGIPCEKVCGTGVIATLKGAKEGPVTGLRADMDALPIQEKPDTPYRSQNPGVMHACGHDCHVAMLLTAARVLKEMEAQLYGTVKFIFQPAEEIIQGAQKMHTLPQLADLNSIAGAHVWLDLDVGTFSAEPGPRMACADNIYLTVHGKSSHGAQPHQSVDAILAACAIVEQLQIVASRKVSPLEPVVVSIGTINGGTQSNIIANEVRLSGTVRCFSPQLRSQLPGLLENIALSTAQAHGAVCDFTYEHCTPPTINHEKTTEIARGAIAGLFGPQSLVHMEKTTGGEDFAWYLERVPGCFIFVGARNQEAGKCYPHHHECFDVDEEALSGGAAALAQFALDAGKP